MKIIANNYVPPKVKHEGYKTICPSCGSVFIVEQDDLRTPYPGCIEYTCPCCHIAHDFKKAKTYKISWEE